MDLSLQSIKANKWSVDNFKKHITSMSRTLSWALFHSCQLTMTWMSIRMPTVKLNTDGICLGTCVASNAWSVLENNTCHYKKTAYKRAYYMYYSHMIKNFNIQTV